MVLKDLEFEYYFFPEPKSFQLVGVDVWDWTVDCGIQIQAYDWLMGVSPSLSLLFLLVFSLWGLPPQYPVCLDQNLEEVELVHGMGPGNHQ